MIQAHSGSSRQHTDWSKHITPNFFRVQCPRRFWEIRPWSFVHVFNVPLPSLLRFCFFFRQIFGFLCDFWEIDSEILHTCLMWSCRACYEWFFFRQIFGFLCFFGIPHFQRKAHTHTHRTRLGWGTLNTCAIFQGLSLKNGLKIWAFVW